MRTAALGILLAAVLAAPGAAQDADRPIDVMSAINGVWAYDPAEVEDPGDFTCAERPMALMVVDGGARVASKRPGEEEVRYGLILDVRNDFPLGPALSIVWSDAPRNEAGEPLAAVLVMDDADGFAWIRGDDLNAFQEGAAELMRSPRRVRCPAEAAELEDAAEGGEG